MFRETFKVDGLNYELSISDSGCVEFTLTGGASPKGYYRERDLYNLFPNEPIYEDVNLVHNGLTVLRKVKDIILDYLYVQRPWKITFHAATARKVPVYRWMAERIAKKLPDYNLVEAPKGSFNFYKQVSAVA